MFTRLRLAGQNRGKRVDRRGARILEWAYKRKFPQIHPAQSVTEFPRSGKLKSAVASAAGRWARTRARQAAMRLAAAHPSLRLGDGGLGCRLLINARELIAAGLSGNVLVQGGCRIQ